MAVGTTVCISDIHIRKGEKKHLKQMDILKGPNGSCLDVDGR